MGVASTILGTVQRCIGVLQQIMGGLAVVGKQRNADARTNVYFLTSGKNEWLLELVEYVLRNGRSF